MEGAKHLLDKGFPGEKDAQRNDKEVKNIRKWGFRLVNQVKWYDDLWNQVVYKKCAQAK